MCAVYQVSNTGDIVYALPRDFQSSIRARSWLLRAQPALAKLAAFGQYLVRVTFGTALITSVLLVWVTIMAILTSSQSSSSDDRRCERLPHTPGWYALMLQALATMSKCKGRTAAPSVPVS